MKLQLLITALALLLCQASESTKPDSFVVHEWGTYTSLQGSNGMGMRGLHHGEEALPDFVKSRGSGFADKALPSAGARHLNGIDPPPAIEKECLWCSQVDFDPTNEGPLAVTQKLETPVLYFYSPKQMTAEVEVGFPNGLVTEVYPTMTDFLPRHKEVTVLGNSTTKWNILIHDPKATLAVHPVDEKSIWVPSREVSSNYVSNEKKETEKHIFYRGVGQFQAELHVTSTRHTMSVTNTKYDDVSNVFVLQTDGVSGWISDLGRLGAGNTLSIKIAEGQLMQDRLEMSLYVKRAVTLLESALMQSGLYPLEAAAMVQTWAHSYFRVPGIRVLYVAPRTWTEKLLPLKVTPQPEEVVRVLVGRVEVFLQEEESKWAHVLSSLAGEQEYKVVEKALKDAGVMDLYRFAEPKLRRAMEVARIGKADPLALNLETFIIEELTV